MLPRLRVLVDDLMKRYGVGVTKACAVVMISRSLYRYESCRRDSGLLVMRIHVIARARVQFGYRRVHVMLRREGCRDNHKRVYRLYREQGLSLRRKRATRNKSAQRRQPKESRKPSMTSRAWTSPCINCSMVAACVR